MRRQLTHRPLLCVAFAMAIGLAFRHEPWILTLLLPLVWLAPSPALRLAVLAAALVGLVRSPAEVRSLTDLKFVQGNMTVTTVPRIAGRFDAAVVEASGSRYVVYFPLGSDVSLGDVFSVVGVAHPLREGTDRFWVSKGVVGRLELTQSARVSRGPALIRWGRSWRDSFRDYTAQYLQSGSKEIADALCFNVENGLDGDLQDSLRRTGTVHIISASGLHVGIFAVVLQWILSRFPIPRPLQLCVLLLILIAYVGATGMRPPVVRSVIMAGVMLTAYLWRQEGDLVSALGLATLLQLLWDPWSVFDLGLHLSFMAVLGLGLFVRFEAEGIHDLGSWLKIRSTQTAHASLVAGLATAPIIAWHFGIVSVLSVVANLLVTPLVALIVPGALAGWAGTVWSPIAQTASVPVGLASKSLEAVVTFLGDLPFSAIDVPAFSAIWIPVAYVAMAGLWREHVRPA